MPAVDIYETDEHEVVLKAELPDMKREDISITFENGVLTIVGERNFSDDVKRENYHRVERHHGTFTRSFTLPNTVDASTHQRLLQGGRTDRAPPAAGRSQAEADCRQCRLTRSLSDGKEHGPVPTGPFVYYAPRPCLVGLAQMPVEWGRRFSYSVDHAW